MKSHNFTEAKILNYHVISRKKFFWGISNNITPSHWNNDPDKINEQISMLNGLPGNAKLSKMKTLFDVQ